MSLWPNRGDRENILQNVDPAEAQANGLLGVTDSAVSDNVSTYTNGNNLGAVDGAGGAAIPGLGSDSLFNPFYIFRYAKFAKGVTESSAGTYDVTNHRLIYQNAQNGAEALEQDRRKTIENPTASVLIEWAQKQGKDINGPMYPYPYQYNDFLWCKWYGKIPNNRLLTLRRYPIPVEDNLRVSEKNLPLVPIAQAVTWWGEGTSNTLSGVLGMTYGFNWNKTAKAEVSEVQGNEVDSSAILDALGVDKNSSALRGALQAIFFTNPNNPHQASGYDETLKEFTEENWKKGAYWNRVLGPINVIDKTYIRDRGFDYTHSITLTFEYSLRSYGNINPKVAMMDLLSNFLALTYNKALFWGGSYRYWQKTGYIAVGLNNEKMEDGEYIQGAKDILTQLGGMTIEKAEELKKFVDSIGDKFATATDQDAITKELTQMAENNPVLQQIVAARLAPLMQKPLILRALLDGRAVGEWHLTVGNPMDPIAVIGNLCLQSTSITFTEELGDSDFPVGVKFAVVLESGRPRAKQDIESMFNSGAGDMGITALQPPASAFNSYGEYNSIRLSNALDTAIDAGVQARRDLQTSAGLISETAAPTELTEYFKRSVTRAYGENFGNSPILPSYFQELKTKD